MLNQPIAEFLNDARVALTNAQSDTVVQTSLAAYGYDAAKLAVGSALLAEAELLTQQQAVHYGHQFAASEAITKARGEANVVYMRSLKVARVAFEEDVQASASLFLEGNRKQSVGGWLHQTMTFYTNLLADPRLIAAMAEYGYTEAKLTAEQALIMAVHTMNAAQEREKGDAQVATKARDKALQQLSKWLSKFRKIAAVALEAEPQKLEALGFGPVP